MNCERRKIEVAFPSFLFTNIIVEETINETVSNSMKCEVTLKQEEIKNLNICERFSAGLLLSAAVGSKLAGEWERLTILKPTCLNDRASISYAT